MPYRPPTLEVMGWGGGPGQRTPNLGPGTQIRVPPATNGMWLWASPFSLVLSCLVCEMTGMSSAGGSQSLSVLSLGYLAQRWLGRLRASQEIHKPLGVHKASAF